MPAPDAVVEGADGADAEELFGADECAVRDAGGVGVADEVAGGAGAGGEVVGEPGAGLGEGGIGFRRQVEEVGVLPEGRGSGGEL